MKNKQITLRKSMNESKLRPKGSDLDRFIDLYESVGVKLKPERKSVGENNINDIIWLFIREGMPKVDGYCGFYTYLEFDRDGKFIIQMIGE